MRKIPGIIFHWPAWNRATINANRGTRARALIKQAHLSRGYKDIGYHYIIALDENNRAQQYDGRPDSWKGAHTYGQGNHFLGVCVVYPMDGALPPELENKAAQLVAELSAHYGFDINANTIKGHRDFMPNQCPGDPLYKRLGAIRDKARSILTNGDKIPRPQDKGQGPVDEPQIREYDLFINGQKESGLLINSQAFVHIPKLTAIDGVSVNWRDGAGYIDS